MPIFTKALAKDMLSFTCEENIFPIYVRKTFAIKVPYAMIFTEVCP